MQSYGTSAIYILRTSKLKLRKKYDEIFGKHYYDQHWPFHSIHLIVYTMCVLTNIFFRLDVYVMAIDVAHMSIAI